MTDALDVAKALTAAINARDIDAVARIYHPELAVWHSNDGSTQNRDENLAVLAQLFSAATEVRYDDIRCQRSESGFVQQHVLVAESADGPLFEPSPVCLVVTVKDGQIARLDEYIWPRRPRS